MNDIQPTGRLHPWSWIFYATRALRELALPLIVFLLVRRDDDVGTLVVTGAAALFVIGYGIVKSITFRFEVLDDEIVIRDGVLFRELRHVPFTRISRSASSADCCTDCSMSPISCSSRDRAASPKP